MNRFEDCGASKHRHDKVGSLLNANGGTRSGPPSISTGPASGNDPRPDRPPDNLRGTTKMNRLIPRSEVLWLTGLSRSMLYFLIQTNRFPRPKKVGPRAVRWLEAEVLQWIDALPRSTGDAVC